MVFWNEHVYIIIIIPSFGFAICSSVFGTSNFPFQQRYGKAYVVELIFSLLSHKRPSKSFIRLHIYIAPCMYWAHIQQQLGKKHFFPFYISVVSLVCGYEIYSGECVFFIGRKREKPVSVKTVKTVE